MLDTNKELPKDELDLGGLDPEVEELEALENDASDPDLDDFGEPPVGVPDEDQGFGRLRH